jgi:hypothetical protein
MHTPKKKDVSFRNGWKHSQIRDNITFWQAETSSRLISPARKLSLVPRLVLPPASKACFLCLLASGCPQHARLFLCYHSFVNAYETVYFIDR